LHPTIAVVTNIDAEHLEYYGTLDRIKQAFTEFCNGVPFYGYCVLCRDDTHCRAILDDIHSVALTYGLDEGASLVASNLGRRSVSETDSLAVRLRDTRTRFDVTSHDPRLHAEGLLGSIEIRALGSDNVRNALAACAVGLCLGLSFDVIADGLGDYDGVQRRMQVRGEVRGVVVVLATADRTVVTDIYPSREAPMPGVDASLIVDEARKNGSDHVELIRDMNEVPALLAPYLQPNDVVLVLGAGDINRVVEPLLNEMKQP
jgi:UDP-N-acetylmuramate--alanine ligase